MWSFTSYSVFNSRFVLEFFHNGSPLFGYMKRNNSFSVVVRSCGNAKLPRLCVGAYHRKAASLKSPMGRSVKFSSVMRAALPKPCRVPALLQAKVTVTPLMVFMVLSYQMPVHLYCIFVLYTV